MSAGSPRTGRSGLRGILPILDVSARLPWPRALEVAEALLEGGAQAMQLRAKTATAREMLDWGRALEERTRAAGAALYVNDRADVALLVGARGVHLGQTDLPARAVRGWLPAPMEIGVSCHDLPQLEAVAAEGAASYVGYGPVYPTRSKERPDPVVGLEGLARARRAHPEMVMVAIGGIGLEQLGAVRGAGASAVAMIAALCLAEDPRAAMEAATEAWLGAEA